MPAFSRTAISITINEMQKLADKYGMQCWTNAESFDRDMPIKFLPIKFDKLRMKLEAAARQKYDKAITFEFSQNGGTFIFGARCLLCQQIAFESLEVLFHPYALLFSLHEGF